MSPDPWYSVRRGVDPLFSPPSELLRAVDVRHGALMVAFALIALGGYLSTHVYWVYPAQDFFCELFASAGAASASVDLLFVGLAILLWIAIDHRALGFSVWTAALMIAYGLLVAIAVTVPIYLLLRTSRLAKIRAGVGDEAHPGTGVAFLVPFAAFVAAMAYWHFGPTPFDPPTYCAPAP